MHSLTYTGTRSYPPSLSMGTQYNVQGGFGTIRKGFLWGSAPLVEAREQGNLRYSTGANPYSQAGIKGRA